jgi:primosomal protein N''
MPKPSKSSPVNRWSGRVTQENSAFDLEKEIFTWKDPKRLALSLKQSADSSTRLKSSLFRSAVSMLVFYINRAGKNLDKDDLRILEQAKKGLRTLYGKSHYQ